MKRMNKETTMTNLLIFIAIVIIINIISLNLFFRLDFSKGKIYSLSPASKSAINQLEDRLIVKAYFTREKDLPPQYANVRRYTRDLLEEYKNYSGGKFRYEFIDPKDENELRAEAQKSGVGPVNVQVRERDKIEVRQAYLGLVFHYNDKTEAIPLVQESRGLEYEITKAISKLAAFGLPKVAFYGLTPDIPDDPRLRFFMQHQDRFQQAKESIRQNYELVNADLDTPIPADVSTLVFSGVVDSLTTQQLYNLDQFLMNGNNIIFFQDRVDANLQTQQAQSINSNLFDLLNHYGIKIAENLVLDSESGQVNVQQRQGIFTVNTPMQYPFFPLSNSVNTRHPIVSQLSNIQFVFVSELDTLGTPAGVRATPLIYTSNNSATVPGPRYNINIQQFQERSWMNRLNPNRRILAGLYEGVFMSYFNDKSVPFKDDHFLPQTSISKIVVVPDMDFISSQGGGQNPNNMNFLMNAVDYLSNNSGLIALRSREVINKPLLVERLVNVNELLPEVREKKLDNMKSFLKVLNILLPSILLVLYGLLRYRAEINKRKRIKELYEK